MSVFSISCLDEDGASTLELDVVSSSWIQACDNLDPIVLRRRYHVGTENFSKKETVEIRIKLKK
jgi:hypothetical protein